MAAPYNPKGAGPYAGMAPGTSLYGQQPATTPQQQQQAANAKQSFIVYNPGVGGGQMSGANGGTQYTFDSIPQDNFAVVAPGAAQQVSFGSGEQLPGLLTQAGLSSANAQNVAGGATAGQYGSYGSGGAGSPAYGQGGYGQSSYGSGGSVPQVGNTNVYTPQQSQEAVNLARAQLHQQITLPGLLEAAGRPGMSVNSPYQTGQALTNFIGPGQAASQQAGAQIPFGDAEANARNRLLYEDMFAGQNVGYGNVANRINSAQRSNNLQTSGTLAQLLASFL